MVPTSLNLMAVGVHQRSAVHDTEITMVLPPGARGTFCLLSWPVPVLLPVLLVPVLLVLQGLFGASRVFLPCSIVN